MVAARVVGTTALVGGIAIVTKAATDTGITALTGAALTAGIGASGAAAVSSVMQLEIGASLAAPAVVTVTLLLSAGLPVAFVTTSVVNLGVSVLLGPKLIPIVLDAINPLSIPASLLLDALAAGICESITDIPLACIGE